MIFRRIIFFTIVALASVYSYIVYTDGTSNRNGTLLSEKAIRGKLLWQQYNCTACHQLYGLGGYMGPDLTNEIKTKGADYARAILMTGTAKMPNFHMDISEREDLIAYLVSLSRSGEYPITRPNTTIWGDMIISRANNK